MLVLGESVRRDYLHAYDYPVKNTPFLNAVKGTVVEGMTSAGKNTVASLRVMLTHGKVGDFPDYSRTVTELTKADGLATYWLLTKNMFYGGGRRFCRSMLYVGRRNESHVRCDRRDALQAATRPRSTRSVERSTKRAA